MVMAHKRETKGYSWNYNTYLFLTKAISVYEKCNKWNGDDVAEGKVSMTYESKEEKKHPSLLKKHKVIVISSIYLNDIFYVNAQMSNGIYVFI